LFAVKHSVGVLSYPIADDKETAGVAEHQVQFYVAVTEYEVVYVGMGFEVFLGVDDLELLVLTQVFVNTVQAVLFHAFLCPCKAEPHAPAGRQQRVEELAHTAAENASKETERTAGISHSVTMSQEELLTHDLNRYGFPMQYYAALALQVAESPDVVIAYEIVYLDAAVSKF